MAVRQESKHEVIATLRGRYRAAGREVVRMLTVAA
jgi:hypothetical protein